MTLPAATLYMLVYICGGSAAPSKTPRHYEECEARRGNPFSLGEGFLFCMLLEVRIATPVCALRLAKSRLCRLLACTRLRAQWFAMTVCLSTFSVSTSGFGEFGGAFCSGGSRPSPTVATYCVSTRRGDYQSPGGRCCDFTLDFGNKKTASSGGGLCKQITSCTAQDAASSAASSCRRQNAPQCS